ncbi:MAG TPA: DegV family protein [Spirochaetota bacterium]|nr:DegV family protein [Spirochaetota bacterium]HPI87688.1 DegV family protein [Spirochaetota bacterium]HPR48187.1 DegV family protein [Spirochaetota bacterium]
MNFNEAVKAGYERLAAWSELLDRINVYPVADGDTGRNLLISLAPLRFMPKERSSVIRKILLSARGNSGNIAARFFSCFLEAGSLNDMEPSARRGRDAAFGAVDVPRPGTMLTLFDSLCGFMNDNPFGADGRWVGALIGHLEGTVKSTQKLLPKLEKAGVVDSGALGMFLFFEGFFSTMAGMTETFVPVSDRFRGMLSVASSFSEEEEEGYCLDMVLDVSGARDDAVKSIAGMGESVVVIRDSDYLKVHLHTGNREDTLKRIGEVGKIVRVSSDDLAVQVRDFRAAKKTSPCHIVSDAAGSLTRDDASRYGFSLLDSYILAGEDSVPETFFPGDDLYALMKRGVRVSTSQASVFERHQHYERLLNEHERVLYLCVGSVYTGNYATAVEWKKAHDPGNRFRVIDTGIASGKLGLAVLATARCASGETDADRVTLFAEKAIAACSEYLFLERLHYLAAGGRMSRTGAFFGDLFSVRPVVSPFADGARKVGIARSSGEQIDFLIEKMKEALAEKSSPLVMLQYTDNADWVRDTIKTKISAAFPGAECIMRPLSLTTGAHTGPGTWGVSFLPGEFKR